MHLKCCIQLGQVLKQLDILQKINVFCLNGAGKTIMWIQIPNTQNTEGYRCYSKAGRLLPKSLGFHFLETNSILIHAIVVEIFRSSI